MKSQASREPRCFAYSCAASPGASKRYNESTSYMREEERENERENARQNERENERAGGVVQRRGGHIANSISMTLSEDFWQVFHTTRAHTPLQRQLWRRVWGGSCPGALRLFLTWCPSPVGIPFHVCLFVLAHREEHRIIIEPRLRAQGFPAELMEGASAEGVPRRVPCVFLYCLARRLWVRLLQAQWSDVTFSSHIHAKIALPATSRGVCCVVAWQRDLSCSTASPARQP